MDGIQAVSASTDVQSQVEVLRRALLALRFRLQGFDGIDDADAEQKLLDAVRLTEQTSVLSGDFLVAVAGHQGVGKTTLVREIYGLDGAALGGNLGRGEKMPVIVREREGMAQGQRLWLRRLAPTGTSDALVAEEVVEASDAARWVAASRGELPDCLVVGIDVPPVFFGSDRSGFLLLPGFEEETRKNRSWQQLLRLAMATSPSLILVTDQDRLASTDANQMMTEVQQRTHDTVRPLVVLTRTEALDAEQRLAVKARALDVLGTVVPPEDVVTTGSGDPAYRQEWMDELRRRLDVDRREPAALRGRQLELLTRGLSPLLRGALKHAQLVAANAGPIGTDDAQYSAFVEAYRVASRAARQEYAEALDVVLQQRQMRVDKEIERHLERTGGWIHVGSKARGFFTARSSQVQRKGDAETIEIWNSSCQPLELSQAAVRLQPAVQSRAVPVQGPEPGAESATVTDGTSQALVAQPAAASAPQQVLRDLVFISGRDPGQGLRAPSPDFMQAVKLLPALALENIALAHSPDLTGVVTYGDLPSQPEADQTETVAAMKDGRKLTIIGLGAVLGVDLAVDGDIDSVPAVASAIQAMLFGTKAGSAAVTAASALAAGVVVAGAVAGIVAGADRMSANHELRTRAIIDQARATTRDQLLREYDRAAAFLEERLSSRLRGYLQLDTTAGRVLLLQGAIADAQEAHRTLLDACEVERAYLG